MMPRTAIEIRLENYIEALVARAEQLTRIGEEEKAEAVYQIADELLAVQGKI